MHQNLKLLSPFNLGPYRLQNRVVMAPMTRNRATADGVPTPMMAEHYAQRASAGLIVTEGAQISTQGRGYSNTPGIHSREQILAWRQVTEAVHSRGGRIFLQLWHVGRISHPVFQEGYLLPVAPSAIAPQGLVLTPEGRVPYLAPRALRTHEVPRIVAQFRAAAENAMWAGFDGVEIHGANGYLLDQFLRDGTNHRTDYYGGSVENRARLHLEVTEAVAQVWGADRVGMRLSPSSTFNDMQDSDPRATFGYLVEQLDRLGLAYLHLIEPQQSDLEHGGTAVPVSYFRPLYHGTLMTNGGLNRDSAEAAVSSGSAELVSFGRPYIANPDLVERFRIGATLNSLDSATIYGGDARGYIDYPTLDQTLVTEAA